MSDADIPIEDKINALKGALRWREEVLMLRAENDRLREVLKEALDMIDAGDPNLAYLHIRAALAKEAGPTSQAYWRGLPEEEKAKIRQEFRDDMYGGADD